MKKRILIISLLSLISFNCGVWYDFTTYFNLYFNTSSLFDEAETQILAERKNLFDFAEPNIPGAAVQNITKVLEKASKILQFNQGSSFVEDALFITGKCFYYQKNYIKSIRKFTELSAQYPESDFVLLSKVWIAKNYLQLKNYPSFLSALEEVKKEAIAEDEEEILTAAYIEEVKYFLYLEKYPEAIKACGDLIAASSDDVINAQAQYQIGEIYLKLNDSNNAADAFAKVHNFSPSYDIELNAYVKEGKAFNQLEKHQEALEIFTDLRSEDKNSTSFDMLELETGITYKKLKDYDRAYNKLKMVDTAYASSIYAGAARYELGDLFEVDVPNYDSAAAFYLKASTSSAPVDYLPLIRTKNLQFTRYKGLKSVMLGFEKQLAYLKNPDLFIQDSLAYAQEVERLKSEQTPEQQEGETKPPGRERDFGDDEPKPITTNPTNTTTPPTTKEGKPITPSIPQPVRPVLTADSLSKMIFKNGYELGNLFFTEINQLDSANYYYTYITDNFPDNPNYSQALFALGSYYSAIGDSVTADTLFNYIYDNFKQDKIVNATAFKINKPLIDLEKDPSKDKYLFAENLMKKESYDSSYAEFFRIYQESPRSKYAPQSLLAAGWILENKLTRVDSAIAIYDTLMNNYPKTPYAAQIAPKLTFFKQEKQRVENIIKDSIARIEREKIQKRYDDSLASVRRLDSLKNAKMQDSLKNIAPPPVKQEEIVPPEKQEEETVPPEKQEKEIVPPEKQEEETLPPEQPKEEIQNPPEGEEKIEEKVPPGKSYLIGRMEQAEILRSLIFFRMIYLNRS